MNLKIFYFFVISSLLLTLSACAPGGYNKQGTGATLGALGGAAACNNVGKGNGRTAAMIGCALIGGMIGSSIGAYMDEVDRRQIAATLQNTPTNVTATWTNHGGTNYVRPITATFKENGRVCRNYQTKIIIDGNYETGQGTACRRPDGYWDI